MMDIKVQVAKELRERINATHIVIIAVDESGTQSIATHGKTELQGNQAAIIGNNVKKALGWPLDLCNAKPVQRKCKNCTFYKPDYGIHCFNGWSGDGSKGHCHLAPVRVDVLADQKCSYFEPNC